MLPTSQKEILSWVDEVADLTKPESIIWIDGSEEQLDRMLSGALEAGELIKLNQEKLPGCYLHRSNPWDVARVEDRTFVCTAKEDDAGPANNWMDPAEMRNKLEAIYRGCMQGRAMYVIPYSMGIVGSPFAKYGIEITDSIYVVHSMSIMARIGNDVIRAIEKCGNEFVRGLHSMAQMNPEQQYVAHFPEDALIMSVNSNYGGNAMLGKKCFALRIASFAARKERWLAEHMLILGIENPDGETRYIAAAFPSACGKTNLAMLIPPDVYKKKGYKVWCLGDDIAWLRIGGDGRLWAVNPENGFFGVAPGTNEKSNYNAMASTRKDTIFTNVAMTQDGGVWWEGLDKNPPANALDWKGEPWDPHSGKPAAHPNSRFTSPAKNCPCLSREFDNPQGVPISAIVFGGRRARVTPLVYEARSWQHGVFVGSIMASETTAASKGKIGVVRRDPMAMLPFCGYNMGDYWQHWLDMGEAMANPPRVFNVNWFRTDDCGKFIWPGFGENMRILDWIMERCFDRAGAQETKIGLMPRPDDINVEGLELSPDALINILNVDTNSWLDDIRDIRQFYDYIGSRVPRALWDELNILESSLNS